jgi:AAHS family 4-hydroxybenzoate transporter-like MFS transporter
MATEADWVDALIDRRPRLSFHGPLLVMCLLLTVADGFDLVAIAFAAPALIKEWGLPPEALAPLFSLGFVGGLFGPPLFGLAADRIGRKQLIVGGSVFYGICTLGCVWVSSLPALIGLRFLAGIAISGVLPTVVALLSEYGSSRSRGTFTIIGYCGVSVGGLLAGLVAARFMAEFGWRTMFWVGGIGPIVIAVAAFFILPESLRFLARHPSDKRLERLVARMGGSAADIGAARNPQTAPTRPELALIFRGQLRAITPLLWLTTFLTVGTMFLLTQWIPVLTTQRGGSIETASLTAAFFQLGGLLGGLSIMVPLDRFGYRVVAVFYACAIPFVAAIGLPGLGATQIMVLTGLAGFFLNGLQFGNTAIQGQVYPTDVRSFGVGLCFMFGRLGSIVGPAVAGGLIAMKFGAGQIFYAAAIGPAVALAAAIPLAGLIRRALRQTEKG